MVGRPPPEELRSDAMPSAPATAARSTSAAAEPPLSRQGTAAFESLGRAMLDRVEWGVMKTGLRIALHVILALVAVVIFYVGLGVGLTLNPTIGTVLWFASGALFVGNLLWLILFLNKRREAAQR